jgi:hypothetical protein
MSDIFIVYLFHLDCFQIAANSFPVAKHALPWHGAQKYYDFISELLFFWPSIP